MLSCLKAGSSRHAMAKPGSQAVYSLLQHCCCSKPGSAYKPSCVFLARTLLLRLGADANAELHLLVGIV